MLVNMENFNQRVLLIQLGEDPSREGLAKTPHRGSGKSFKNS